ncbi:MAG: amidase [Actinomycetota bacterium]
MATHHLAVREELSDFEWAEATIVELSRAMEEGRTTSRALAEDHIARIEANDSAGPRLNSIMEVNPDALAIAARLDDERSKGSVRGPLHGIPVLLKDNIDTADEMETSAGSLALLGARPTRDAFVAQRLRAAGAVILGKTNLSEWANFRSTQSSSGWSGRAGQCLNPYALDRNPSGSSSGSAVAVAANLAPAALGTETDGSIVSPAGANSIVGIKPTVGLTSRAGVVPVAHSQDVVGPMCRTVADAAAVLGGIAGVDRRDKATRLGRDHAPDDYTRFLDPGGLRGARLGVWRGGGFGHDDSTDAIMEKAIDSLRDAEATIVDPTDLRKAGSIEDLEFTLLLYEFKADLNEYLRTRPRLPVQSLEDLITFNEEHSDKELTWFDQEIFLQAQDKGSLHDKPYRKARNTAQRFARVDGLERTMRAHRLDAIVAPTGGPPWLTDLANGDHHEFGSSTPAAVAGYPSITVPAGYSSGLPVGMSFIGRAWSEPQLISYAYSFEQATRARRSPEFASAVKTEDYRER